METRDTQDVGTEDEQGAGRQMEVIFTGGSDTGVGGECYQPGALELQVGQCWPCCGAKRQSALLTWTLPWEERAPLRPQEH